MTASHFSNSVLVEQLLAKGANPYLTDNAGRTAFQIALQKALLDKQVAQKKLAALYQSLLPDSLSVQATDKLIKLDVQRMEFFLVNAVIALAQQKNVHRWLFSVDDFLQPLLPFPEAVMPERRKRRAYISGILAKNEIYRNAPYNRQLFLRVKRGYYVLNPQLRVKMGDDWVNIYTCLNLEALREKYTAQLTDPIEARPTWQDPA
jgi:hypothetical protein